VTDYLKAAPGLVLAALMPLPALAQEAPAEPVTTDEVIVTAQRDNQSQVIRAGELGVLGFKDALDTPFSVKGYNAALILNQQPQTLGQVLENDPSIRTTYGFGNAAEQFVIRGFPLYSDDIALNGLYGVTPRQLVSPELYEQVQVLNGASAFLNGAAPGGTGIGGNVNLVTKRAGDRDLTRVTGNYQGDSHFGGAADVSRRFGEGRWGVRVNGAFRSGDVAIDREFRRNAVVGAALDYRGEAFRAVLDLGYQNVRVRGLRPKVTVTDAIPRVPDADANYAQAYTFSDLRDVFGTVRLEYDVAPDALLYLQAGARDGRENGIYDGLTVTDVVTGAATGSSLDVPLRSNNESIQGGLRVRLASGGISHEVNVGGSWIAGVTRTAFDFRAGYLTNLYDTPQIARTASGFVGGDLDDPFPISRTRLGSAFASDTIGLFDDRLLVTAGLRLQNIVVRNYAYADGSQSDGYDEDAVTPVVGAVFKLSPIVSLFANRIESLAQGPTAPQVSGTLRVVNAGEVFAPFRSVQYEAGGKLSVGPFNASLAAYTTERPLGQVTAAAGDPTAVRFGLFGEQRNRGIELSVDGELSRGLRVIAGGAIQDAKLRDTPGGLNDGNRAPGVPTYLANANVEWDLPFVRGLTATGRLVQTGRQRVDAANTLSIPTWTRVDLGARYVAAVADRPVTFRVAVDNVANERYWASAFDAFSQTLLQGTPRTYKASVSVDF